MVLSARLQFVQTKCEEDEMADKLLLLDIRDIEFSSEPLFNRKESIEAVMSSCQGAKKGATSPKSTTTSLVKSKITSNRRTFSQIGKKGPGS